jgi:ribosomal protein S27E
MDDRPKKIEAEWMQKYREWARKPWDEKVRFVEGVLAKKYAEHNRKPPHNIPARCPNCSGIDFGYNHDSTVQCLECGEIVAEGERAISLPF